MRILHVVPSYLPAWRYGGPIRSVHGLARAQAAAGHAVEVFTTDADGPSRLAVPTDRAVDLDGVRVHYFPLGAPARLFRSPALGRSARRHVQEFEIAHLHSVFLWPTLVAARSATRAGVPYVVAPRGMLDRRLIAARGALRKRLWIALCERRTLARAAAIHLTSEREAAELRALRLDLAPLAVVANGVSAAGDDEPAGPGDAERVSLAVAAGPYLLALGRIAEKKRLELLIEAVAAVPELRLVIAGNDEEVLSGALRARAARLGIAGRVQLLGEVRGAPKRELLASALALALPSTSENFGNVVLESLAAGRPAIVSPEVGAAEIVERSRGGYVVAARPELWSRAIRSLLDDPAAATAMGSRGRELVRRELSWERIAATMQATYESAIERARAARP